MSVVVCLKTKSGYEIASDSIVTRGFTQTKGQTTDFSKLFEENGMVVGLVGLVEEGMLMRLYASTNRPSAPTERGILEFLSDFSDWKNKRTSNSSIENSYIIWFQGVAFATEQWLVQKVTNYQAIGAGMDFALASLYLGHSAVEAVETAIELSVFCESPVQLIKKDDDEA